ncbi:MAG: hypothetical protein GY803_25215 [Chloroflexi bacterium]|nr:hypothetical protein [Chloroflexota bacterium]
MKTPFVWLGSGRAKKWDVDDKARLLDQAAKASLPVPAGGILLDEFFQLVVAEGVVAEEDGRFFAPDPHWLAETLFDGIRFPRLDKPVAVRAAFSTMSGDDGRPLSYPPQLSIDFNDPAQLAQSLCATWSHAVATALRRDLLIMEMVPAQTAGFARNDPAVEQDAIEISTTTPSSSLHLSQLRTLQRPRANLPPYAQRLQQLLRGARRAFGKKAWEIVWADDGRICWLLQITILKDF